MANNGPGRIRRWATDNNGILEEGFVLRLEKVMSCILSELHRILNWHVLRLAATSARAFSSPSGCWRVEAGSRTHPRMLARTSFEKSPFVAWHGGRQNSTGRETSFWLIAHTGLFEGRTLRD